MDVKAVKSIRGGRNATPLQDKLHWVEWLNVQGNVGWARAPHLNYVAFQTLQDSFLLVKREELEQGWEARCAGGRARSQYGATEGKYWSRYKRKDMMTLLTTEELMALPSTSTLRARPTPPPTPWPCIARVSE